jgi:alcohol dehydrogenase YqhD (iron-dependent ADH family)
MLDQLEQTVPLADLLTLEAAGSEAVFKDDRVIAAVMACVN